MARGAPNPTRFWGLALGPYANFKVTSSNLIATGDTTPSVEGISLLYNVTGGELTKLANFDNGAEGQMLILVNVGTQLTWATAGFLKTSTNALATNSVATFINHNSIWYQVANQINTV